MNRTLRLALVAIAGSAFVLPALAQGDNFPDAPEYHWAYQALLNMKNEGILVGYPDGLFRGGRPASRYEMAAAIDRAYQKLKGMLGGVQNQIDALNRKIDDMGDNYASKADLAALRDALNDLKRQLDGMKGWGDDIAALKRMADMFQKDLAKMGVDVEAMKKDLADMGARLTALEKRKPAVDIHGDITLISHMGHSTDDLFGVTVDGRPTGYGRGDYSGDPVGITRDWSFGHEVGFEFSGTNDTGPKWHATLVAGNFVGFEGEGGLYGDQSSQLVDTPFHEGDWEMYIQDAEVNFKTSVAGQGMDVRLGRVGYQTNRWFFSRQDRTPYMESERWDNGNWYFDGGVLGFHFGSNVSLDVFGGRQSALETSDDNSLAPMLAGDRTTFGLASGELFIDQHLGFNLDFKFGEQGGLMLNYIFLDSNSLIAGPDGDPYNRVVVMGAALNLNLNKQFSIDAGYGKTPYMENSSTAFDEDNAAYWAGLAYNSAKTHAGLEFRHIDPFYGAPGSWDRIGFYWNPVDLEGFGAWVDHSFNDKFRGWVWAVFANALEGVKFDADDEITSYGLGVNYMIRPDLDFTLDWESVRWGFEELSADDSTTNWYRIGFNWKQDEHSKLKLWYEISDHQDEGLLGGDRRGGLFTLQWSRKF